MSAKKDILLRRLKQGGIYLQSVKSFEEKHESRAAFKDFEDALLLLFFLFRNRRRGVRETDSQIKKGDKEGGLLAQWATDIADVYGIRASAVDKTMHEAYKTNNDIAALWPNIWPKPDESNDNDEPSFNAWTMKPRKFADIIPGKTAS